LVFDIVDTPGTLNRNHSGKRDWATDFCTGVLRAVYKPGR